jgi:hypothetical protein
MKVPAKDIGVIVSLKAQQRKIFDRLRDIPEFQPYLSGQNSITVATVDSFQGLEKEVIIYASVRSNNEGNIGFLEDERRFNVAVTRAKRLLVFVGNVRCLKNWRRNSSYGDLFHHAKNTGQVINCGEQRLSNICPETAIIRAGVTDPKIRGFQADPDQWFAENFGTYGISSYYQEQSGPEDYQEYYQDQEASKKSLKSRSYSGSSKSQNLEDEFPGLSTVRVRPLLPDSIWNTHKLESIDSKSSSSSDDKIPKSSKNKKKKSSKKSPTGQKKASYKTAGAKQGQDEEDFPNLAAD